MSNVEPNNKTASDNDASRDLQASSRLTIDAIIAVSEIVESMHHTIATLGLTPQAAEQRQTRGISRLVYRSIRSTTQWVGKQLDKPLAKLGQLIDAQDRSPQRERLVSILNGVLGDHLEARDSPLAIRMQWRQQGEAVDETALAAQLDANQGRMLLMIHGLCMNDHLWQQETHNHGLALAEALGMTPVYLFYNTGRHISDNGQQLNEMLGTLSSQMMVPLQLQIVSHSMGGLVARSAAYYGKKHSADWLASLQKIAFLGTPHHGALLEKGGNLVDTVLPKSPYSAPFARLAKLRSCGITDLRYGHITEHDWSSTDRFQFNLDQRLSVPLTSGVECYAVAAVCSERSSFRTEQIVGDGLVTLNSALGRHRLPKYDLAFPSSGCWIAQPCGHNGLLSSRSVYAQLLQWFNS
ncbi:esterase/lipase family protein [Ferrimonas marina]|uniref:esterase/lipase family protein n=1 Tax=Ferrimonas marina TaxID=299255 RepID=UPI0008352B01|nr:hypothetical protein [Ferrimonas marina]